MPPKSQACCSHDHDCEATDCGVSYSLYKHVDVSQVRCLNERVPGSGRNVLRPWHQRLESVSQPLRSNEDDTELLLHIPFDGAVKLKGVAVIGGSDGTAPSSMKAYINRDDLDFATAHDLLPVQEWELVEDLRGVMEYPTHVAKFNGVHSIDLLFSGSFGADFSEIQFIGLKGEFSERKRQAVEAVYETKPMPGDHKVPGMDQGAHWHV